MSRAEKALAACAAYDRWEVEVTRLTAEIAGTVCPREYPDGEVPEDPLFEPGRPSCFTEARKETTDTDNWIPGHGDRRLNLDEIAEEVADCPSCSRLCRLIADRKEARKQVGIAKRRCRLIGRAGGTS